MKNKFTTATANEILIPLCLTAFFISFAITASFGQKTNGYLGIEGGVYLNQPPYDVGAGLHFSGNAEVSNDMFMGLEIGAVKLHNLHKPYLPLLARFSMMPSIGSGKARLLIVLAPGYGFYDDSYRRGQVYYKSKGGFSFYGGVGAAFKGKQKGYLTVTIGYSTFGFTANDYKTNVDGLGIRFGGIFN